MRKSDYPSADAERWNAVDAYFTSLLDFIAAEPQLMATAIQTVGEKGWDGFVLARVLA